MFVAIDLPDNLKKTITETISDLKKLNLIEGNFVGRENLHLTLKFLGEVPDKAAEKVSAVLTEVTKLTRKFPIELKGLGHFDERVLWIGSPENKDIVKMANNIDEKLSKLGFAKETRPFAIHLTLCRIKTIKNGKRFAELLETSKEKSFGSFVADKITLMKSTLGEEGAVYSKLADFALI